jgi:hypothetical protein
MSIHTYENDNELIDILNKNIKVTKNDYNIGGIWLQKLILDCITYDENIPSYIENDQLYNDITENAGVDLILIVINTIKLYKSYEYWDENESNSNYEQFNIFPVINQNDEICIKIESDTIEGELGAKLYIEYARKYILICKNIMKKEQIIYNVIEKEITNEIAITGFDGGNCFAGDELAFRASLMLKNYNALKEVANELKIDIDTKNWTVVIHECTEEKEISSFARGNTYIETYSNLTKECGEKYEYEYEFYACPSTIIFDKIKKRSIKINLDINDIEEKYRYNIWVNLAID